MSPLKIYRLSNFLYRRRIPLLPKLLKAINYVIFNCVIPPECVIGKGTRLSHSGLGVIIHPGTIIGKNCNIYNHVVFGGGNDGQGGPPTRIIIGDNCNISVGAKILAKGVLEIGHDSTIGAGAVVLSHIPPNSVAVGIPAKVVKSKTK